MLETDYENGDRLLLRFAMVHEEFVFQIEGGLTFNTKNSSFPGATEHAAGVAGFRGGKIEIDNFTIWNATESETQKGWAERKAAFPAFELVVIQGTIVDPTGYNR